MSSSPSSTNLLNSPHICGNIERGNDLLPNYYAQIWYKHHYYPTVFIQSNCLFFAMSWVTELFHSSINLTIDWHYTMAWLPTSPLKTHRRLLTTMCVRFVYGGRRYATMLKIRHGLATLNSNNSVVYGQKHKVWVLVSLVRTSGTFWDQNWADWWDFLFCNKTASSTATPFKKRC